jgi:transposase
MQDVLSVYERPYDPANPVVCVDEGRKELRSTPRGSLPAMPSQPRREDYEYEREGWANLFLAVEPLAGKRHIQVTDRRTAWDFAQFLQIVSDELYPEVERITLVVDNLNTHKPACLYEAFAPEEAFRLMQRFEWHYTPEHGSWLNMAEIELSILQRQCLSRRLTRVALEGAVPAWEAARNLLRGRIRWQFTTADARVKLRRLYPGIEDSKSTL